MILDKFQFSPLELIHEMNLAYGLILLPFFILDQYINGLYTLPDLIQSMITFYLLNIGNILSTFAIKFGKAGIVQAM